MRGDLTTAITRARERDAVAMFLATEIAPGIPMPVTLTVYAPPRMHMSPAVGTVAETVMGALQRSFAQIGMGPRHGPHVVDSGIRDPATAPHRRAGTAGAARRARTHAHGGLLVHGPRFEATRRRHVLDADGRHPEPHARLLRLARGRVVLGEVLRQRIEASISRPTRALSHALSRLTPRSSGGRRAAVRERRRPLRHRR